MGTRGFTIPELLGTIALATVGFFIAGQLLVTVGTTQGFQRDRLRLADVSDRVLRLMRADMTFAVRVFDRGSEGSACLSSLDLGDDARITDSDLPAETAKGFFDVDPTGSPETGSVVLLARAIDPVLVESEGDGPDHRVDLHQFVCYFPIRRQDGSLDLVRWSSLPLAGQADIDRIDDSSSRTYVLSELYERGIRFLWSLGPPHAESVHAILQSGVLAKNEAPIPGNRGHGSRGLLGSHRLVVAEEGNSGTPVPLYRDRGSPDTRPVGLEVKIDGPASARMVLVRLVVSVAGRPDRLFENRSLMSCRGL